jgi:amino acid permease
LSFVRIEHLGAAWFAFTACAAYVAVAFPPRNFAAHRAWTWRHVAAGLSVALQRVFIALHHVYFNAAHGFGHAHGVPELQKPIFADSLIFGVVVAVVACESCVALARPPRDRAKKS